MVAAVAGETPARFRRRVLFERAAYQLLSTENAVLTVAMDAGYSSSEAFARAFRRAYGRNPADWRADPGPVFLDSPNGVHFHPPGGIRLPALTEVTSMDFLIRMIEHHIFVTGELIERSGELTDAQLDAAIEISVEGIDCDPTIRSLLSRLVGQMAMWNASMAGKPYDWSLEEHESLESIRARMAVTAPEFLEHVRDVCGRGRLDETFVDATCDPPRVFTYGGMVAHVLTYAAHRRTMVTGALYSAGITDVEDDPMTWPAVAG